MNCLDCAIKDKKIAELTARNKELMFGEFKYLTDMKEYQLLCSNCHSIKSYYEKYID